MPNPANDRLWSFIEQTYLPSDKESLQRSFARHMEYSQARTRFTATPLDCFKAAAYAVRDRIMERWNDTQQAYRASKAKRVCYLSLEFLLGRALGNNLLNLGLTGPLGDALQEFGYDLEELQQQEADAGLGNGGLGRLAACFLDSLATQRLPAVGYGIRYEWGIFEQRIDRGSQVERPDPWLRRGFPWEIVRPEYEYAVGFGGSVTSAPDEQSEGDELRFTWQPAETVLALAHDVPVVGHGNDTVNTLRLWSAQADQEFDLRHFNRGDYVAAVEQRIHSQSISSVLYPKDDIPPGRELRLRQEYFFVAATLQDILRRHRDEGGTLAELPDRVALQLNDTHPALAVPELMRLLMDREGLGWAQAWDLCQRTCAYTNHTVLPEALEVWPVDLLGRLLPRHLQIIYEINRRYLDGLRAHAAGDDRLLRRMSIIQEEPFKAVRMAHLAIVGSHMVNGVSALHTELLRQRLFRDFVGLWPERFCNKTNGITPRRWLALCNPGLAALLDEHVGAGWITDLDRLEALRPMAADPALRQRFGSIKRGNKERLGSWLAGNLGLSVDPDALFEVHAKRIHEYKRQLLCVLHVLHRYLRLKAGQDTDRPPRLVLFAGKAAPGYAVAKRIIELVHAAAALVNGDSDLGGRLQVGFLPNYGVSLAERLIPAADLSVQISTAGLEASGTGNMKFSLNGALTIGTLDGANIEIRDAVGPDNMFIFGHTAEQLEGLRQQGYHPGHLVEANPELAAVLELLGSPALVSTQHPDDHFRPLLDRLLHWGDRYFLLADFASYLQSQRDADSLYSTPDAWSGRCILNVAGMGRFSSDRTIREYAEEIWGLQPVAPVDKAQRRFLGA